MTPDDYCQQRAAASGSSFYYSFLFLEPERRRAITALYAFCREVDDAVDETSDPHLARTKLAWWRQEIAALYAGTPSHPVTQALARTIKHFPLPQEQLLEIIDGMEMDIDTRRYPDFRSLHLYCYRVASVVGLLAAEIFGYSDRRTLKYAHDLGLAFQLTNIIRDVGEDARRGRIYLPQEDLAQFGVSETDILQARYSDSFRRLMEFQITRAEATYEQALAQLPASDRKAQRTGLVMAAIYRTLLAEIARDGCHVLHQRIGLPPLRKLWLATSTWVLAGFGR
jgi:phytoene synthase